MPDAKQDAADATSQVEVDVHDAASTRSWADAPGLTSEALESAVKAVGPRVDRIKDFLTGGLAGQQADG